MFRAATYNIRCRCSKFQNSATFTSPQTTPRKTTLARSVNPKSRSNRSNSNSFGRSVLLCAAPIALALPAFALGVNCQEKQEQADKSRNTTLRIWPFPSSSPYPTEEETPNITAEMTTTPSTAIMPGRPETLTAEEEAKLKDLWNKVLKCFGVAGATSGDNTPSGSATPSGAVTPTESNGTEKKKTTSLGRLLSRREKTPAAPATPAADDLDDKYGASKDYQTVLASQTPAELRDAFWAMVTCDHPDGLLLRFLRARKWDVEKALVMMVATMHWRIKEMDVR
jgi:hypothetical protein